MTRLPVLPEIPLVPEKPASRFIIYGLLDPRPERYGELRYIGKSVTGLTRPRKHWLDSGLDGHTHLAHWRKRLIRDLGLLPMIKVLEETTGNVLGAREKWWIAQCRMAGADLVNTTDGGEGMLGRKGWKHTKEAREKMRAARVGRKASPETREKMRLAHLGRKMPDHLKEKLLLIHIGRKHSEESIEKMREVHRTENLSEETRAKMSASQQAKIVSDETRARQSKAHKGIKHTEEAKAKISAARRRRVREMKRADRSRP